VSCCNASRSITIAPYLDMVAITWASADGNALCSKSAKEACLPMSRTGFPKRSVEACKHLFVCVPFCSQYGTTSSSHCSPASGPKPAVPARLASAGTLSTDTKRKRRHSQFYGLWCGILTTHALLVASELPHRSNSSIYLVCMCTLRGAWQRLPFASRDHRTARSPE